MGDAKGGLREFFESGGAGAGEFLDHKSDHPFALAVATATILRGVCEEFGRVVVALDERIYLASMVDAVHGFRYSSRADDDLLMSKVILVNSGENLTDRLYLGRSGIIVRLG